ncbi:MAG: hypothetical protein HQK65_19685, partial [Desulfamplus sp.]|nr:hypothetical protein [Desulfamplus sp.]
SKGELSKKDFGLFVRIFKAINPDIKDTNTIKTGQCITIPLKKSNQNDFKESKPGVVDLPIITLSQLTDKTIKDAKLTLEKSSSTAIQNKASESSNTTKTGDKQNLHVPEESSSKQESHALKTSIKLPSEIPIRQLKQFAMFNNGQLMTKGKYYFPRDKGEDLVVDVAVHPLIHLKNGTRILFVPDKTAFSRFSDTIKTFWKNLQIMEFGEVNSSLNGQLPNDTYINSRPLDKPYFDNRQVSMQSNIAAGSIFEQQEEVYVPISITVPRDHKTAVKVLLDTTSYKYRPEKDISVSIGNITVQVSPGFISRDGRPDILIVFGDIYGSALESLKKLKLGDIVIMSPLLTPMDVAKKLFSAIGASTTENPAFVNPTDNKTISLNGFYIKNRYKEIFITEKPMLLREAFKYLTEKNITILRIDRPL